MRLDATPSRRVLLALAALLVLQVGPWWRPTDDSASYLSIAKSAAHGEPRNLGDAHLYYPPGYPALLAPWFLLSDRPFLAISLLHLACALLWLAGVHLWGRRLFGDRAGWLTALVAANVGLWTYQRHALSEVPFAAALTWAALAFDVARSAADPRLARRAALVGGAISVALVLLRPVGICVPLAFAAAEIAGAARGRRPRHGSALAAAVGLLPAAAAVVAVVLADRATAGGSATYVDRFAGDGGLLAQVGEGLRLRASEVGRLLLPGMSKAYGLETLVLYVPLALAVGWGWWRLVRRVPSVLALALPLYVAVYVVWPFDQGIRFLTPVVPVLWAAALQLLLPRERIARVALPALVVLHLAVSLALFTVDLPKTVALHGRWPDVDTVVARVGSDRDRVAASGVDRDAARMLRLALDRPVEDARRAPPTARATWVVLGRDEAPPPGFALEPPAGSLRLARRR